MFTDEKSDLDRLSINFLQDPRNKHRFPDDDEMSEEEQEIIKEVANKQNVSLISIYR